MILYFTDRQLEILGQASTELPEGLAVYDDLETEEIDTGVVVFEFKTKYSAENYQDVLACVKEGNYILKMSGEKQKMFTIIEMEDDTKKGQVYVYAEDAGLDLLNEIVEAYEADKAYSIAHYINKYANDSGFVIGVNEAKKLTRKLSWDGESTAAERIASVAHQFDDCEIEYSFDIEGLRVKHKYINIYKHRGKDLGVQLRLNKDIDSIVTTKSIADLATALKPTGGTPKGKDKPITLRGYEYDDGDFYVSGKLLKSRTALKKWKRFDSRTEHILRPYSYDTVHQSTLCRHAITALKKYREVAVNYEVNLKKLPDNAKIGDRINIINDAGELYVSARILKLETSEADKTQKATLGEYLIRSSGISDKVAEMAADFAKEAQELRSEAVQASLDSAEALREIGENEAAIDNIQTTIDVDLAFKTDVITARTLLQNQIVQNAADISSVDNRTDSIEETATGSQQTLKGELEWATIAQNEADAAALAAQSAQDDADDAQDAADDAQDTADTAQAAALSALAIYETAKEDLNEAKEALAELLRDPDATDEDIEAAQTEVTTAQTAATTAQTNARTAMATAQTAQNAADLAQARADIAQLKATNADAYATSAQNIADDAQDAADDAQDAADDAIDAAALAQATADTAKATAAASQKTAKAAQEVADAAQEVLVQANDHYEEVIADPDATQEEIDEAEQAVTDAQAAYDSAQADADEAQSDADDAQAAAVSAQEDADEAHALADEAMLAVDGLETRFSYAQTQIRQNAEKIELSATKTELDALEDTTFKRIAKVVVDCESIIMGALASYTETDDFEEFKTIAESQFQLLSDELNLSFTQLSGQIDALDDDLQGQLNQITTFFTFDINGFTIGKTDSPYKIFMDDNEFSMLINDTRVLWFELSENSHAANIPELTVTNKFSLFGYEITESDGIVSCEYVGSAEDTRSSNLVGAGQVGYMRI